MSKKGCLFLLLFLQVLTRTNAQINFACPLNTQQSIQNGSATVNTSTLDIGSIADIFDGNDATLARSANINPLVVTISFTNTVNLTSIRVIQSYGEGWFTLEAADVLSDLNNQVGTYQKLLNQIATINGVPIGGAITMSVSASKKIYRLTVKKTVGDNFVHLNEWGLTGNVLYQAESFEFAPASINMHPGWEIWLNNPTTSQCPIVKAKNGANSFPINQDCISWSVSNSSILDLNSTTKKLKALVSGTANLIATIGNSSISIPVVITRLQSLGEPDLSVRYIKRLPEINYVQNSTNPTVEGWPANGQTVTWRAHVKNWSANSYNNISFEWKKNGTVISSGTMNFSPDEEKTIQINDIWTFQKDSIEFTIDKLNIVSEFSELNNNLKIYTYAISANFYVEQSLYDYFHVNQNKLGIGTNSWDDWIQILHVKRWNKMFREAIFPDAPNGVLDRIRIDSIIIVPDNALPLSSGVASNNPDINDKLVDLQWGFEYSQDALNFYANQTSPSDNNPFFFEGSLLHELGHARYLIDSYGMDVNTTNVFIKEGNINIGGSTLMPIIAWDVIYYNQFPTLMSGVYDIIGLYEAMALNRIAYRRAVCGNMNAPCNFGIFINDLPTNNFITLKDKNNNILSNACVEIYRATPQAGTWYGKTFDDIPDLNFTADINGKINVGRNPFSTSNIIHTFGQSQMDLIMRVESNGKVGYKVIEATDFNIEYWRGNTVNANYTYNFNMLNCSDFQGSSCTCNLTTIQDISLFNNLVKIFPNPVQNKLQITRSVNISSNISIRMFDITGREMKRITSSSLITQIDLSGIPSGTYLLLIEDKLNKISGRKLITKQ